jgi:hypothetical protein
MTTKEKIEVMQHFGTGGEVEHKGIDRMPVSWKKTDSPTFNWEYWEYRKKPKEVEILYEWWYADDNNVIITSNLVTEKQASEVFSDVKAYGKTGRFFNPETKLIVWFT